MARRAVGTAEASIFIGGSWKGSEESREAVNPTNGEVVYRQANAGADDVAEAIEAASSAQEGWAREPAFERAALLDRVAALLGERAESIGRVLAEETGKLKAEAVGEVRFAASYFSWFAEEARRHEWVVAVEGRPGGPQVVLERPVGVVACLTPWNFPVSIQARKVAPALAAGCAVVSRPSEEAPGSVVELFRCLEEAGAPDGVANLLTGPAREVTAPLLEDARVRLISFTGSTGVGKSLYEGCAPTMKRLALELGGSAPFVVCEDADLDLAAEAAMLAKLRNCGQSCVAANVFYVQSGIYEEFTEAFAERIRSLRMGDPLDDATTLGPVINAGRKHSLEEFLRRAEGEGFSTVASSETDPGPGLSPECFMPATLISAPDFRQITPAFLYEEVFGPVATVAGFSDLDALIPHLDRNPLGLAGYVFSRDVPKAMRVAASLQVGIAGVNEGLASAANVPMGGVKDSGLGREGGHMGLEEFLDTRYIAVGSGPALPGGLW
jgi:succinate-semialdehyde dehydrogenase/glutarate-semialdehyde dehydrogenase